MNKITKTYNQLKLTLPLVAYGDGYSKERRQVLLTICDILDKYPGFKQLSRNTQSSIVVEIENSCYDKLETKCAEEAIYKCWNNDRFVYLYSLICGRVISNLDMKGSNDYIINAIINNSIDITKIGYMDSDSLNPSIRKKLLENINSRKNIKLKQKTTSLYTCKNCKMKNCSVRFQQMRSLDEGQSMILTCQNCGFRFIIGT